MKIECSICSKNVSVTGCGHLFHSDCVFPLVNNHYHPKCLHCPNIITDLRIVYLNNASNRRDSDILNSTTVQNMRNVREGSCSTQSHLVQHIKNLETELEITCRWWEKMSEIENPKRNKRHWWTNIWNVKSQHWNLARKRQKKVKKVDVESKTSCRWSQSFEENSNWKISSVYRNRVCIIAVEFGKNLRFAYAKITNSTITVVNQFFSCFSAFHMIKEQNMLKHFITIICWSMIFSETEYQTHSSVQQTQWEEYEECSAQIIAMHWTKQILLLSNDHKYDITTPFWLNFFTHVYKNDKKAKKLDMKLY